jgi:hypothetical protein
MVIDSDMEKSKSKTNASNPLKIQQGVDRSHGLARHEHNKTSQINKVHGFIVVQRKKIYNE